jgi:hypothetical protein
MPEGYEWLECEIEAIETRRFHVIEGASTAPFLDSPVDPDLLPLSYVEFIEMFGGGQTVSMGDRRFLPSKRP